MHAPIRKSLARTLALIRGALVLLGLVALIAMLTPLSAWYGYQLSGGWHTPSGDTLIVLGGDITWDYDHVAVSGNSYLRCLEAVRAFHQGGFRSIVATGQYSGGPMRDFLITQGIPAAVIRTVPSRSTREDALFTATLLRGDPGRKVLLTSDFHMFRARRAFRRAGLDTATWPAPDAPKGGRLQRWPMLLTETAETIKIGYYFARGWI